MRLLNFIVHHDLSNAKEYFDQIILLNMRLIAYGDVDKTFNKDLLQKTYGGRLTVFTEIADQSAKNEHVEHEIK
jgi:manganese/zinc/iron transport system ATP- binding protein